MIIAKVKLDHQLRLDQEIVVSFAHVSHPADSAVKKSQRNDQGWVIELNSLKWAYASGPLGVRSLQIASKRWADTSLSISIGGSAMIASAMCLSDPDLFRVSDLDGHARRYLEGERMFAGVFCRDG